MPTDIVRVIVFNATFNNISVLSRWSVLLMEETTWWVPRENHRLVTSHWQTLSHNVVSSTPRLSVFRFLELELNNLIFCVVLYRSLFVHLYFFSWSLYCLSFHIRFLIIPFGIFKPFLWNFMTAFFKQIWHNCYDFRYKIGQSGQRGTIGRNDKFLLSHLNGHVRFCHHLAFLVVSQQVLKNLFWDHWDNV